MRKDDLVIVEREVSSKDILKRIFNEAERGPRKRDLINAEARKAKIKKEQERRSANGKRLREERMRQGLCTRCGLTHPTLGRKMCLSCRLKGREYMKGR